MLKGRWRCLYKQRMLHYKPTTCSKIINACSVLHNICIENFDTISEEEVYCESHNANETVQFPAGNALHTVGNNNRVKVMDYIIKAIIIKVIITPCDPSLSLPQTIQVLLEIFIFIQYVYIFDFY